MPDKREEARIEATQKGARENQRMLAHRFFFAYAYELFTHLPLYLYWKSLLSYVRRLRTVTFVLRLLTGILTVIETGALVILSTALFLVILPVATALMLGILITALLESRQTNRYLRAETASIPACVLFMSRKENPFLWQNAESLAADGRAVFVVSPYWISPRGKTKSRFYCTARKESDRIFLVRRYYVFSLRKAVLDADRTAYFY